MRGPVRVVLYDNACLEPPKNGSKKVFHIVFPELKEKAASAPPSPASRPNSNPLPPPPRSPRSRLHLSQPPMQRLTTPGEFSPPSHISLTPLYDSKQELKDKLTLAVQMEATGFDIE